MEGETNNQVFLLRRNVVSLYQTPIPLEENSLFTLDLRIEQDPLKIFPFQDMCSPAVLNWIYSDRGLLRDQLIPFLVQQRGLWDMAINPTLPRNSVVRNYFPDMPASPETQLYMSSPWYATRAFRTKVKITIGDEAFVHLVMTPGNPEIKCDFTGGVGYGGYTVTGQAPDHAWESTAAVGSGEDAQHSESGGGPNYDFTVSWDGFCVTTVHVEAKQQIRISVHVEQDEVHCPGGWGINSFEEVECWKEVQPGPIQHVCTIANPLPYTMGMAGYDGANDADLFTNHGGLGAHVATRGFLWLTDFMGHYATYGLPQPRDTPWSHDHTYSLDNVDYDWTETGSVNLKHYAHMLAWGFGSTSNHRFFDPTVIRRDQIAYVRSIALCGSDFNYRDGNGNSVGLLPFASGEIAAYQSVPPYRGWASEFEPYFRSMYMEAKVRLANFETVYAPPKVKITATYSATGGGFEVPETTRYFYGTLPYSYVPQCAHYGFEDIYTYIEPSLYHQPLDQFIFDTIGESDDRFSYGVIRAAVLNCEFALDREGFTWAWLPGIPEFPGESTIPETSFYEDADTFIDGTNGSNQTYQEWLGIDDGGGGLF